MTAEAISHRTKLRNNVILAVVPALGFLYGAPRVDLGIMAQCLIFALSFFLLFAAARLLENGFVTISGEENAKSSTTPVLIFFLGASFLITLLLFRDILFYWLVVLGLSVAYFSGFTRFKNIPILSTLTFFVLNLFAFAAGYGAYFGINLNGFIFGIYFALIFAAGQLVGEIAEANPNEAPATNSNPSVFGHGQVFRFSFGVFGFAFVYLVLLSVSRFGPFVYAVPFLLAFLGQAVLYLKLGGKTDLQNVRVYQFGYRVIYSLATAGYIAIRLALAVS